MKWRFSILVSLMVVVPMLTPGVALSGSPELAAQQVFRWGHNTSDINTLDPAFSTSNPTYTAGGWIFNGLVRNKPGTVDFNNLEGDLAKSWDISDDHLTYTFHLRKGVQWHKGYGEFTAEDVKCTFERLRDKKVASPYGAKYLGIKEIKVTNLYTVKIILEKPNPFFLMDQMLAFQAGMIVPKKLIEERGKGNLGLEVIGTGPFQFEKYIAKEKVVLVRNANYFRGAPTLERVEFHFMPAMTSKTFAFINGDLDAIVGHRDPKWLKDVLKNPGVIVDAVPLGSPATLHFNMTAKPLDDVRVRKALAYAIDREQMHLYFGAVWTEMSAPVPPSYFGALPKKETPYELQYNFDLKKAKKLLTDAGYPGGGIKLKAFSTTRSNYLACFEQIAEMWRPLGVELKIEVVDHTTYHHNIRKNLNDVVIYYAPRPPFADSYLTQFYYSKSIIGKPTGITNFSHYGDVDADGDGVIDSIDSLIEEARSELNPEKQKQLYYKTQLKLLKHAPSKGLHVLRKVLVRHDYFDPGFDMKGILISSYPLEKARILKH